MSLSDLASIGSLVSGVAVLVSLVYLAQQIRQSSRNQRAAIHHDRMAHIQNFLSPIASSRDTMDVYVRGMRGDETLDAIASNQFVHMAYSNFLFYQEYFMMRRDGMLDDARFRHAMSSLGFIMAEEGARAAFAILRPVFDPDFVRYVEDVQRRTPVVADAGDFSGPLKAALAAGRAARPAPG